MHVSDSTLVKESSQKKNTRMHVHVHVEAVLQNTGIYIYIPTWKYMCIAY